MSERVSDARLAECAKALSTESAEDAVSLNFGWHELWSIVTELQSLRSVRKAEPGTASCPTCHGTGDHCGNPDFGQCDDCGGSGSLSAIEPASPAPVTVDEGSGPIWYSPEIPPTTPKGTDRYFIVAVRRAHNGKVWTFPAQYLNAYPLMFEVCGCEGEPDGHYEDGCPCTGWYTASSDGEYDENYSPLLSPGDELVAWSEIQMHPKDDRIVTAALSKGGE